MKILIVAMLMTGGLFFFSVGTIGILRFPDVYTRAHSATKCDTLGAVLCLLGLMIYGGIRPEILKLFLLIVFIWITNPTAAHLIGLAAKKSNVYMVEKGEYDKFSEVKKNGDR